MGSKRVRLSADSGTSWFTLPGNTASLTNEAGEIVDTVFGQDFQSNESGLIGWSVTANALYKGFAGYVAKLKITGTPTTMTDEAMSLVSGKTYQITAATKQVIDPKTAVVVKGNAVAIAAANIESIDYLYGKVTFKSAYTPTAPITISGKYLPTADYCGFKSFTLTQTAESIDTTDMCVAQANDGHRTFDYGLKTARFEASGIYSLTNANLAKLQSRGTFVIEIGPDGSDLSVARGFFRMASQSQSGSVGALEEETVAFNLNVPDIDLLYRPFTWNHAVGSTLNQAIRIALNAWETKTSIDVQYLPDGLVGVAGDAIVTEISLAGGLEVMNEFSVSLQGTGKPSTV